MGPYPKKQVPPAKRHVNLYYLSYPLVTFLKHVLNYLFVPTPNLSCPCTSDIYIRFLTSLA